jgi:putative pyoverdin transport system ATP-binding/permease protein
MSNMNFKKRVYFLFFLLSCNIYLFSQNKTDSLAGTINHYITEKIKEGKIPGLSCIIINNGILTIKNYGYSDLATKTPVTSKTLFELGSCSKAFTALAILNLAEKGKIDLGANVSEYLPWVKVKYKNSNVDITLNQLLHHTSGIPWYTISMIPKGDGPGMLEQTVRKMVGISLHNLPGKRYEYATINYDILGLVIEKVSGQTFESYVKKNIFVPLGLTNTSIGKPIEKKQLATGYKTGFFEPREYHAPIYKGNNPAGYVISNAEDIARWLKFQMGEVNHDLYKLAQKTQLRDESVAPHELNSYAMGWEVSLTGNGEISHAGLNPNYSSYMAYQPSQHIGVAILTNSSSSFTPVIAGNVMRLLAGEKVNQEFKPDDGYDKAFSVVSIIMWGYILAVLIFFVIMIIGIYKKKREFQGWGIHELIRALIPVLFIIPLLYGIWLLPKALASFSWEAALVWTPVSFPFMVISILAAIALSYVTYLVSLLFPEKNEFKRVAPQLLIISILSGVSNMFVILLITNSLHGNIGLRYLVFYYLLALIVYISSRRYVQTHLIRFSRGLTYDIRIKLIEKIFSTSYQKFEKIDRGRVYATLNDDVGTIGDSTNTIVGLITNLITAIGAFLYLATIAFWATFSTLLLVGTISTLYYIVSRNTRVFFEEARDTRNVFMRLLNGMVDGFKELSLHRNKKLEFKDDIAFTAREYRDKISTAHIRFVNAFLIGESSLIIVLGVVAFAIPRLLPGIAIYSIMSFIIVLLYLIGPVNGILGSVPAIMQLRIAWNRVQTFLKEIPANLDLQEIPKIIDYSIVESIKAKGVTFDYKNEKEQTHFSVGPVNLEIKKGEILFIIGGNGSGKTTLAKLLTGLYQPDNGSIMINDKEVTCTQLSEYFSTVFSPYFLFEKLYGIDLKGKVEDIREYLRLLDLTEKVEIGENRYSTIALSGGQRKRLALLQCYLENYPVYLFDEWAADQDPEYRKFFYRELLPRMKKNGKIVIAITHDDHYFDVADKILKLDMGKMEFIKKTEDIKTILSN